jgi:hypothetical protein
VGYPVQGIPPPCPSPPVAAFLFFCWVISLFFGLFGPSAIYYYIANIFILTGTVAGGADRPGATAFGWMYGPDGKRRRKITPGYPIWGKIIFSVILCKSTDTSKSTFCKSATWSSDDRVPAWLPNSPFLPLGQLHLRARDLSSFCQVAIHLGLFRGIGNHPLQQGSGLLAPRPHGPPIASHNAHRKPEAASTPPPRGGLPRSSGDSVPKPLTTLYVTLYSHQNLT